MPEIGGLYMKHYNTHIERNPQIMLGKPVVAGTRITVELIMRKFAGGYNLQQLLAAYPQLTTTQINAAFEYAADVISNLELNETA